MLAYWLDLGFIEYAPAFQIQEQILAARLAGALAPLILLQENPPTFTIGRTGSVENILVSPALLHDRGIQVLPVNRGGDITYHAPGQIIVSPLLYLGDVNLNANQYLHRLEDILIDLLAGYGVSSQKDPEYPGVYVDGAKIASVGIAVRHGYTFHGFAINVNLDLEPFSWINPCGIQQLKVTSLASLLGYQLDFETVKLSLRHQLSAAFDLHLQTVTLPDILSLLPAE